MIDLQRIWPFALAAVVILALGVLTLLLLLLRRSARASRFKGAEPEPPPHKEEAAAPPAGDEKSAPKGPAPLAMRLAFGRAGRRLDGASAGDRHRVPFFLLLGAEGSRESDLLANAGLELPFGNPAEAGTDLGQGRGFWFLDRGVVLDLAGDAVLAADGRSSDERGWKSILHLLQKLRPKRPVDGVVLAVSCRELAEAQRSEAALEELAARAGRVYRKLWQMQQRLGFRLPVYLLVTGCEKLPGFGSLGALVPPKLREEMLGWSSPYGPDAAYRSGWVDDAFAALGQRVADLQMEVFADTPAAADSLFLLPGAVRALNAPVRGFLDQLFKQSAYHESLMLRGIYFCGREEESAAEPERSRRTFFVKDLLNEKAFREAALALPVTQTVLARNRAVRLAQAATVAVALVLGGGLGWASYSLGREADVVEDVLGDTLTHLRQMRQVGPQELADAQLEEWTIDLLGGMARMDFGYFGSAFIPTSWFSPFHERLRHALTRSFQEIILEAIGNELEEEARTRIDAAALQEAAPVLMATADSPVQSIEHTPEFRALQDYVQSMEEVEAKGSVFNRLSEARDLHPLGDLVSFAFHERLPESFYSSSRIYVAALREASYPAFDPSRFRSDASWQAEKLADNFLAALFRRNPFAARLQQLAQDLQGAAGQRSETSETQRFQKLVDRMSNVQAALAGTELVWAFQRQFNLGPDVAAVLKTMETSAIFDPASARRIEEAGRSGFSSFQNYLSSEGSPMTGPILSVRDGRPEMKLSEGTVLLQGTLKRFLSQGFVAAPATGQPIRTDLPPGTRLIWDAMLLDQATAVTLAFERFRDKGLDQLPEELRPTFGAVALDRTKVQVVDLIARAQRFDPIQPAVSQTLAEDELKAGITTFEASRRPVDELMNALGHIRLEEARRDLASSVSSEANRLLRAVDRLLDEQKAYEPRLRGFSWWDGITPPSPAAWDAGDETGVQIYLEKTRRRIADLAQVYAQPLLVWLTRTNDLPHDVRSLTDKWEGLLDDIRGYEAKKPGNSVAAIEDYILNQMPKVDARNCQAAVVSGLAAQTGESQFADNLLSLSRQLASRCYAKAGSSALDLYREAARYFNQRLSGRYPFTSRPPGPSVPEADPEDVRAFFRLFDKCQKVFRSVPEGAGQEGVLSDARSFLDRMARARAFFAPYLDAEKPDLYPSFDVEATFRILREREVAANQIISWVLEVGGERITDRDVESRKLRWTLGEPVRLSLRWANDGPLVPVVRMPRAALSVQDREVVYEYRNRWSLLAALTDNRITPRDLPSYTDEQPVTLALAVYTRPTAGGPPGEIPTQVFLRLTVLKPGTTEALDPPPTFPERAPIPEGLLAESSR